MNIISLTQEQVVLDQIKKVMGITVPELQYVDISGVFDASRPLENSVLVTIRGKTTTTDGQPGRWTGEKVIRIKRARLRQAQVPLALRVPYRDAMAIEHILRGLYNYHQFNVSAKELEFKPAGASSYSRLPESFRVSPGIIECRFHQDNIRYDHLGSEFTIDLYRDVRPNVGYVVARTDAGNVNIVSEG
jgi:hypothetical protein